MGDRSAPRPLAYGPILPLLIAVILFPALFVSGLAPLSSAEARQTNEENGDGRAPAIPLAAEASQDGDAEEVPPTPLDQVRAFLDSEDSEDWVRALTVLNIEHRSALALPDAVASGVALDAIGDLLLDYLLDRALENPDRTRRLLRDEILVTPEPGESVLLQLLTAENQGFRPELEAMVVRIAADPARRETLLDRILRREAESLTDLFTRIFPLLAPHEPGTVVGRAIEFYRADPRDDILAAVAAFLGVEFADGDEMLAWWAEHKHEAIHDKVLDRAREAANARTVKLWRRANKIIAEGPPLQQRTWLLLSLDPKESPGPVRRLALQEIEKFVARISAGENAVDEETQQNLVGLLFDRVRQIISGEVTESESLDSDEYHATRVHAVRALRAMSVFRDDESVTVLLRTLIDGLREAEFDVSTRRGELGWIAVQVVGSLRAPVGDALDGALADLIGGAESSGDWEKVPAAPLGALLEAIAEIGVRPRTVELLGRVLEHRPERRKDVVNALLRPVPPEVAEEALGLLASLVDPQGGGTADENLRTLAIHAIGRLDQPAGIPILVAALQRNGLEPTVALTALQSIQEIGGEAALTAIIDLLGDPQVAAVLERELLDTGVPLALADPSLRALEELVIDADGERRRWLLPVLRRPAVRTLLEPTRQLADFRSTRPEAFERYGRLQEHYWHERVAALLAREDLTALAEGLAVAGEELRAVLEYLGPVASTDDGGVPVLEDPLDPVRVVLESIAATVAVRAAMLGALTAGEVEPILTALEGLLALESARAGLLSEVSAPFVGADRLWLLGILDRRAPLEDPTPLLDGLERLAERYPLEEDARELLTQLRSRASATEGTDGTEPPPESGDGD